MCGQVVVREVCADRWWLERCEEERCVRRKVCADRWWLERCEKTGVCRQVVVREV